MITDNHNIRLHFRNCSVSLIPVISRRSAQDAGNSSWKSLLRNNRLDMIWTNEQLGSSDNHIESTHVAGLTT